MASHCISVFTKVHYVMTLLPLSSPGGPLIDGVVVSSRCLSVLVRQTVINVCARHRMENEG